MSAAAEGFCATLTGLYYRSYLAGLNPDNAISAIAVVVSLIALYFTRLNWIQSNRPIVVAYVEEYHPGNVATAFNLFVVNTGTRPAIRVRLHATPDTISRLLEDNIDATRREEIERCFREESEIPVLRNGESLNTAFGLTGVGAQQGRGLRYGAQIDIEITYSDLEGRKFTSKQPLRVYARSGFAGSQWSVPT